MPLCLSNKAVREYAAQAESNDVRAMAQELLRCRKKLAALSRPKREITIDFESRSTLEELDWDRMGYAI